MKNLTGTSTLNETILHAVESGEILKKQIDQYCAVIFSADRWAECFLGRNTWFGTYKAVWSTRISEHIQLLIKRGLLVRVSRGVYKIK